MPKVSVIIPVYNVENYIERCATYLFNQTLDDIEYIFIDDCSPDRSVDILREILPLYPNRKASVKLEKMSTNSRQAAVRRRGIQLATGDYVIHCDSDDWVDLDYYEKMYREAIRSGADVVFAPIVDEYTDSSVLRKMESLPNTGKEIVANWYGTNIAMYSWNKLVKRSIYVENNILPFEGVNMWEDNGLMLRVLYYANKVSSITGTAYHYNHTNMGAMTASYGRSAVEQMIKCADLLGKFFSEKDDALQYVKTVNAVKYLAKLNLITTKFSGIQEFKHIFSESNEAVNYISLNAFSAKGKIRFLFVKYHMAWLFVTIFKLASFFYRK